ncbi:hypothetical protein Cadr_000022529 [Camelus dromedarius]|uniref:Uncharacterized protein n=1 Tax=Camelus dromedarius TaxID=9838 RepID=A0A5N4CGW0_CAMDR|nr:hypothetical protein Cadr_000022529 [Camelus dromedarius]
MTNNAKKCLEEAIRQKKLPSEKALKFKSLKAIEKVNENLNDIIQIVRAKLQAVRDQNAKSPHLSVRAQERKFPVNNDPEFHGLKPL